MKQRLIAIAIFFAVPAIAFAQGGQRLRDRDPDLEGAKRIASELQEANIHYGPFYLLSRLRISDIGYTQEFYLPTGDQESGFNLTVDAPQRLYLVPHKKTIFTVEAVPGYSFLDGGSDGQFNYSVRADAHFLFNHLYLDFYTSRADQLRAHVADINRLVTERADETGVSGEIKYSSRTSALFIARYRETGFPSDRVQPDQIPVNLLDRTEKNGRVSIVHKTFPLTSLFVSGEVSDYEFDRAPFKDSRRRWVGAGFIRQAGRTSFRLEAGPATLEFDDPAEVDFSGIIAEALLTRSAGRWTYTARADRDLGFSVSEGNNYFIATAGSVQAEYSATRKLSLRLGTTYERDDYDVPVLLANGNTVDRRDTTSFSTVGFLYSFRRFRAGIDAGWYQRESTIIEAKESGIRWLLLLSFTP